MSMAKMRLLPGMTAEPIKEIHDACEELFDAREKAAKARKIVNDRQKDIGRLLHKHKLKTYKRDGVKAEILGTERVVVNRLEKQEAQA